ncbi:uncharacterized protein [Triticum aestivum]|nr:uncharacterized protein LOC123171435 [Triticum aestivum]
MQGYTFRLNLPRLHKISGSATVMDTTSVQLSVPPSDAMEAAGVGKCLFPALTALDLCGYYIEDGLATLLPHCPRLRVLRYAAQYHPDYEDYAITVHSSTLRELVVEESGVNFVCRIDIAVPALKQLTVYFEAREDLTVSVLAPMAEKVSCRCRYGGGWFTGFGCWEIEKVSLFSPSPSPAPTAQTRRPTLLRIDACKGDDWLFTADDYPADHLEQELEKHLQQQVAADLSAIDLELHLTSLGHVYGAFVLLLLGTRPVRTFKLALLMPECKFFIHIAEMRVLRNVEDVGGENLTGKLSLAPVETLWNEWEIHCLVLTSLALQFLLFLAAGMRRRSTSCILGAVLWLAYLLADSVAVFVLGHLAVRVSGPQHELIAFWAPFLLVHLGGQDTITALSMQDNELWNRHLLGLVSQVAVAGYVVSKPSWTDKRLLAATVLVFLSGSFKYAVRTCCLYIARPAQIRGASMRILSDTLTMLKDATEDVGHAPTLLRTQRDLLRFWNAKFDLMLGKSDKRGFLLEKEIYQDAKEIMSVDAPPNNKESVLLRDDLPNMLEKFQSTSCLHQPYDYVGRNLVKCYERFYTKMPLLRFFHTVGAELILTVYCSNLGIGKFIIFSTIMIIWLIVILLQNFPIPIALVLFTMAEKGNQIHNRADVTVSYILLIGAIILDVSSASMSILSFVGSNICRGRIKIMVLSVANYIQPTCYKRQWSEELAQYSMVKRYATGDARGMPYVRQWIGKRLIACGVELLDPSMTHTHVTEDLKGFVLNKLVQFGIKKQYNFADFRGQLALQEWRKNGPGTEALYYSINEVKDFPTSILIWHIATDICYYSGSSCTANTECDRSKKKKKLSRELSN